MKGSLILIFQIAVVGNVARGQVNSVDEKYQYPLKSITNYCQSFPDSIFSTSLLKYDDLHRLVKLISIRSNSDSDIVDFKYNEHGLLMSKHFYSLPDSTQSNRTRIFKYDGNDKLIYESYDDDKGNNLKNAYIYNGDGRLTQSTEDCNYTHLQYFYDYDLLGQLKRKFPKDNLDETTYEYSSARLTKTICKRRSGETVTMYEYDKDGLVLNKMENGKVVEKNVYLNKRLMERWTYYFGIDPGYYPCQTQYIYKYEYY